MYLKRAFSAPRIWTVEAGYLARLVSDPAWEMSLAPTCRGRGERGKREKRGREGVREGGREGGREGEGGKKALAVVIKD